MHTMLIIPITNLEEKEHNHRRNYHQNRRRNLMMKKNHNLKSHSSSVLCLTFSRIQILKKLKSIDKMKTSILQKLNKSQICIIKLTNCTTLHQLKASKIFKWEKLIFRTPLIGITRNQKKSRNKSNKSNVSWENKTP